MSEKKFYTVKDVATMLGISTQSVTKLVEDRKLGAHKILNRLRFTQADIDRYLAATALPPIEN